jgi:uncharacterized membrane protein (DUF4010 family)
MAGTHDMDVLLIFQKLGIAAGLGLLVGLQRERTHARLAGIRTFPLVAVPVLGAVSALLAETFGGWVLAGGLLALATLIVGGNLLAAHAEPGDPGVTTETALLVMYALGAYLIHGHTAVAVALGAGTAILLHLKPQMHALAARLGDHDVKAIMQFALVALVILPVLPDEAHGPYGVLNPFKLWLMVVLIVGISLGSYIIYKFCGERLGMLAGGVLGGLISSTATTVSQARRSHAHPGHEPVAAVAITLASAIVFARVLLLLNFAGPELLPGASLPLLTMLGVMALMAARLYPRGPRTTTASPEPSNPSELKSALVFAALYAVVLVAVAAARDHFGTGGLYAVATLSGLTDMDAITLSVAQLVQQGQIPADTAWRLLLVAALANLVFKAATVRLLGGPSLSRTLRGFFALSLLTGLLLLLAL